MTHLHLYLLKRFVLAFVAACILIAGLFTIAELMDQLNFFIRIAHKTPFSNFVWYFVYKIPINFFNYTYPLAVLLATAYVLGKMNSSKELIAMVATGKPIFYFCYPLVVFLLLLSSMLLVVEDPLVYDNFKKHHEIRSGMRSKKPERQQSIQTNLTLHARNSKFYAIGRYDPSTQQMEGVSIVYVNPNNTFSKVVTAKTLTYNNQQNLWVGSMVHTRILDKKGKLQYRFKRLQSLDLEELPEDIGGEEVDPEQASAKESKAIANRYKVVGGEANIRKWDIEHYTKIAGPYIAVVVLLLGIPVSVFSRRSNFIESLLLMVVVAFLFIVLSNIGKSLGINGIIPPLLAGWLGHILFCLISYSLFKVARL